jgi:tetratricopeptide (TPR) repeat protein
MLWGDAAAVLAMPAKERAVEFYRQVGDVSGLGFSLMELGFTLAHLGRLEQAATALAEAFPLLESGGQPKARARYSDVLGFLKTRTGDTAGARMNLEEALSLYRKMGANRQELRTLGNLADLTWALGDLDAARAGFGQTVAILRRSPLAAKSLGFNLSNLAGVLTERGELDEALAVGREALPLLLEKGHAWINMDHFALRAALAGKLANAARLAGYADSAYIAKDTSRGPNEARAHGRLHPLLRETLSTDTLRRLLTDGARMSEDEACRMALE